MRNHLILLCAAWVSCACAVHEFRPAGAEDNATSSLPDYDFSITKSVVYTPEDWPERLDADIYMPQSEGSGPYPAVLVVHGGGWSGGSPGSMQANSKALARAGFVAVNISYRLAPETQFPGQLHDLQQAMHWIHAHADEYKIDTARIGGLGYSAGAHLVSLLAVVQASDEIDQPYGGEQTRLAAVVAGGTPADLAAYEKSGRLLRQFMGGTNQEMPVRYAAASPIAHVSSHSPPFFLYHGQWDTLVPISQAENFARALHAAGVQTELYRLRFRGHLLTLVSDGAAVESGIAFLRRQLLSAEAGR